MLLGWLARYPIVSIEDPLAEDDEAGLIAFTEAAGPKLQIVGDDYLVTNAARVAPRASRGRRLQHRPDQAQPGRHASPRPRPPSTPPMPAAGSTSSPPARARARTSPSSTSPSAGAPQLKVGSFTRSERMAKWNEGLRIAEAIGDGNAAAALRLPLGTTLILPAAGSTGREAAGGP